MRRFGSTSWRVVMLLLAFHCTAAAGDAPPSAAGGKKNLAVVNGEPITVADFQRSLAVLHRQVGDNTVPGGRNYSALLERLINGKLILQEARNIGLDSTPDVRGAAEEFKKVTLRKILLARRVKDIRPDEKEVEKAYRDSIREFKIRSYLFGKEEDANRAAGEIRSGSDFDNVMRQAVSEGKAKGNESGGYVKAESLLPPIPETLSKLKEGEVTSILKVPAGRQGEAAYTILRLEGVRYPESPEAKAMARKEVLKGQRLASIEKYVEALKKKYVKVHRGTLDGLDYDSSNAAIEELITDTRVVAEIRGEKPIRVEDLSRAIQGKYYHGVEQAAARKKVNRQVPEVLNEMVTTRILVKEALRKKIDKTPQHKQEVKNFEDGVLFNLFFVKVIVPDIKVDEEVARKYYNDHEGEFLLPGMVRGEEIAFSTREDAVDALEKLRRGADFKWATANAPGQIGEKSRQRVFPPEGGYVSLKSLPDGAEEVIAGAGAGEYRLYTSPAGQFVVLRIVELVPPKPSPFDQVKMSIMDRLFLEEQQKSMDEWVEKLRSVSRIRILATDREMEKMFGPAGGAAGKM